MQYAKPVRAAAARIPALNGKPSAKIVQTVVPKCNQFTKVKKRSVLR